MAENISERRKIAYYLGMVLIIAGLIVFLSNIFVLFGSLEGSKESVSSRRTDTQNLSPRMREYIDSQFPGHHQQIQVYKNNFPSTVKTMFFRALLGMGLIMTGGILTHVGARGLAGSGLILSPKRARRDLEPYSRMAGGMLKDALEETDLPFGGKPEKVILVRCAACGTLNAEDAKFCKECGKGM